MDKQVVFLSEDRVAHVTAYLFEQPKLSTPSPQPWQPEKRPAILIAPGGGYAYCADRERDPVAIHFAVAGYQTFVLNYHCGDASAYPTPLVEIARAVAHIRACSDMYQVDKDKIAVIGFSAGGHLAAMLGSSWHLKSLEEASGLSAEEMRPNAVLLGYPPINLKTEVRNGAALQKDLPRVGAMISNYAPEKDPLLLASRLTPPTFLFVTLKDELVCPADTLDYVQTLIKHDVSCEFHLFSEGVHGLSSADSHSNYGRNYPRRVHQWVPLAIAWLNELFRYDF